MGEWIGFSIMLLFSIGCYVLSGFFLHGKGACLIAGYNTMSKKEQEQYDKDKLCRSTGYGMLIIGIALTLLSCVILLTEIIPVLPEWTLIAGNIGFCSIVALVTLGNLLFSNTKAKITSASCADDQEDLPWNNGIFTMKTNRKPDGQ